MHKTYFFLFLIWLPSAVLSQNNDTVRNQYVREFPDHFNVKILATDRLLTLNMVSRQNEKERINYTPNDRGYIGLGMYIFDLGIEVAVKVPSGFQRSKSKYGETDFIDFQGNVYGRRWCVDATFQKYEGFYVSNAADVYPGFESGDNYPQRSDLGVTNVLLNGIHIFNHEKFSFRSAFIQADRQIKSAGSVLLILSTSFLGIDADSVLITRALSPDFEEAGGFRKGNFFTLAVLPGYAYNFVFGNVFLNLNATGGVGVQYQKFDVGTSETRYAIEPKFNLRAAVGYDNDRFFAGGSFVVQRTNISIDGMTITNTAGNYKFFVGYRFKEFGILKKLSIKDVL